VHFNDLIEHTFAREYYDRVTHSPELLALKNAVIEIESGVFDLELEHKERIEKNKDHPVVRRVAEFFGGSNDFVAYAELLADIQKHPEKGTLEEREDELASDCPDLDIWTETKISAKAAGQKLNELDLELGLLAYMRAQAAFDKAAHRFLRYENRVMKGAGIAVKWLERAKVAGKIAAGTLAGGNVLAGALISGGYSFFQEGAQQASELAYGQRKSMDWGALTKGAAAEGAMALFGGVTQGTFTKALEARVAVRWGEEALTQGGTRLVIGGTAAAASSFYNVGANLAVQKIIYGRANMPQSLDELANMVLDEASTAMLTDAGMQGLHHGFEPTKHPATVEEPQPERRKRADEPDAVEHGQTQVEVGAVPFFAVGGGIHETTAAKPPAKPTAIELAENAHTSPAAADALIDHHGGRWEETIWALKNGSGELKDMPVARRREVIDTLVRHRQTFVDKIAERFQVQSEKTASGEAESDIDLNMKGNEAGLKVVQATQYLDALHPGWQKRFRMGLMVDASRAGTIAERIAELPKNFQDELNRHHTVTSEAALVARQARLAATPVERKALIDRIPDPNMRELADALSTASPAELKAMRTEYLVEADRAFQKIDRNAPDEVKAEQIKQAQSKQMLANSIDDEAYVTGGAIQVVVLDKTPANVHESYQATIDQVSMLQHMASEAGGMRKAMRRYETFKYIQRITEVFEAAGIKDRRLNFLRNQSELLYNVERQAASADPRTIDASNLTKKVNDPNPDKRPGVGITDFGEQAGVPESHIEDIYWMTRQMVEEHLPALRQQALGDEPKRGVAVMPVQLPALEPLPTATPSGTTQPQGPGGPGSDGPSSGGGSSGSGSSGGGTAQDTPSSRPRANPREETPAGPDATGNRTTPAGRLDAETTQLQGRWKEIPPPPELKPGANKLVFLQDPTTGEIWIFKPARGEESLAFGPTVGIEAQERWRRAAAAARLGHVLDINTPEVHLVDYNGEKGSLQRYHPGYELGDELHARSESDWKKFWNSQQRKDMDVFDFFLANQDRHGRNWMIRMEGDEPRLMLIDQDSSIPADTRRSYEAQEVSGGQRYVRDLPPTISRDLAKKFLELQHNFPEKELQQWLTQPEIEGLKARLDVVIIKIEQRAISVVDETGLPTPG
jgi:hypothetical protein